jgi:hypothetical protein
VPNAVPNHEVLFENEMVPALDTKVAPGETVRKARCTSSRDAGAPVPPGERLFLQPLVSNYFDFFVPGFFFGSGHVSFSNFASRAPARAIWLFASASAAV